MRYSTAAIVSATLPYWAPLSAAGDSELPQDTGLSLPCCVGDVSNDGAVVWLRAEKESIAVIEYSREQSFQNVQRSDSARISSTSDFTAKILLTGLNTGTAYFYRAAVSGQTPGSIGRFVTAPASAQKADFAFAFSGDTRQATAFFHSSWRHDLCRCRWSRAASIAISREILH